MLRRAPSSSERSAPVRLMLDSGAFSAWKLGRTIDVAQYCDFILANLDWIDTYVALDVIIPDDPEEAAARSFANLRYMLGRGLDPIPVLHAGEKLEWLHRMLELGCNYVGLSGSSIVARGGVDAWYAAAWQPMLIDDAPAVKVHAFGEGRPASLAAFPWYSADTASWIHSAILAGKLQLSNGASIPYGRKSGTEYLAGLSPDEAAMLEAELAHDALTMERLQAELTSTDNKVYHSILAHFVIRHYVNIQKQVQASLPRKNKYRPLFKHTYAPRTGKRPDDSFSLYLAVSNQGGNPYGLASANRLGHTNILCSYYYIEKTLAGAAFTPERLRLLCTDPDKFFSTDADVVPYVEILKGFGA